jgi:hypothetical protein
MQQQHRIAIGQDRLLFGAGEPPVERHEDGAEPHRGLLQDKQVGAVAGKRGDPLPLLDAVAGLENANGALDGLVECAVSPAPAGCQVDTSNTVRLRAGVQGHGIGRRPGRHSHLLPDCVGGLSRHLALS